jgi:hypothetical protein
MRTERLDLQVYRNADYHETWQLSDTDNLPIDLTNCTLELRVRAVAGQGPVLATAVITINEPAFGIFTVFIDGAAFSGQPGATEVVRLAYDLRLTYPGGFQHIPAAGQVLLTPGVTY